MDQKIVLNINEQDFTFNATLDDYNRYINSMNANDKIAPSHNFLMSIVDDESYTALTSLIKLPGMAIQIASAIIEEYQPEVNIIVKKPKPTLKQLKKTD